MDSADIIKELMEREGLKLIDLSRKSGIGHSTISSILKRSNKEPRDSTLEPIAKVFGVSKAQLRGYEPIPGLTNTAVSDRPMLFPLIPPGSIDSWLAGSLDTRGLEYVKSAFPRSARTFVYEAQDDAVASYVPRGGRVYVDPDTDFHAIEDRPVLIALIRVDGRYSLRTEVDDMGRYAYSSESSAYRALTAEECEVVGYVVGMPEQNFTNPDLLARLNKRR
jgi:transcriptional regulator with XRE-family HTH domain